MDQHVDISTDVPQIQVEVDLVKAAKYGLKPGDVRRAAATLVAGEEVGDIFRDGKAYDVVVWSTAADPQQRAGHREPPASTRRPGSRVRLADVATGARCEPNPNSIEREGDSRRLDVSAERRGPRPRIGRPGAQREAGAASSSPAATTPRCSGSTRSGRPPRRSCWPRRSSRARRSCCCCRPPSGAGGRRCWCSSPCRWPWSAGCWRPSSAAGSSRSARWSASSRCSGSPRATASC